MFRKILLSLLFSMCLLGLAQAAESAFQIGTYYFGGWKPGQLGSAYAVPWELIKKYPEREPMLGWYEDDSPDVMGSQLKWMREYGVDFVVFNWYWGRDNRPMLAHSINAYMTAPDRHGVKFSIMWSNHTEYNFSKEQFQALFRFWAQRYFFRPDYLKVDGKPVVFLFSAQVLNRNAEKIGMTSKELLVMADDAAKVAGLPGVSVIGGIGGNAGGGFDYSPQSGYAGFSLYNLHGPATFSYEPGRHVSHSYKELDMAYRDHWKWMLNNSSGMYILPMSSGWDKRPWGGSKDSKHDNSRSTPKEFAEHLRAAKELISSNRQRTQGMGVICCWNEFGEGSIIEPTKADGFSFLEQVREVFGKK